ncbi:MAG: AAA family ATPase [Candidatus Paceibacterota bacterium]|jgi:predicted kinase
MIESPSPIETRENQPKPSIILLDGSKGAGKSTVGEILTHQLEGVVFLTLDNERRALENQERTRAELNKEAFENILSKSTKHLIEGTNLIIDCGLTEERVSKVESLAADKNVTVYKFLLKASYETQLDRVRSRDSAKGNETDEARFAEVHNIVHAKNSDDFTIIDTDQLNPSEVATKIVRLIGQ